MKKLIKHISIVVLIACVFITSAYAAETTSYNELFEKARTENTEQAANELANAFFADIKTFMEELAFQDAQTKQAVIDLLVGEHTTHEQLTKILEQLQKYPNKRPTKSETALVSALESTVMYAFYSIADNDKDIPALLAEVMSVNDSRAEGFSYDLAKATIAEPATMIRLLAKEDETAKERVLLFFVNESILNPYHGTVMREKLAAVRETEDFIEDELVLLDTIVGYYADCPAVIAPANPNSAELEAWLLKRQEGADKPSKTGNMVLSVVLLTLSSSTLGMVFLIQKKV